jgi:ATP-dependent protease HslVU (ClpYQ) peptidase subunit
MELLDRIETQLISNRLPLVAITVAAVPYANTPVVLTLHWHGFGVAGSAAHQLVIENVLARNPNLDLHGKGAIYESFRKLHPILKDDAFLNPKEEEDDPYESSQMTAMIANSSGIFAVYSMREVFEFDRFWAIGSGRDFALGAMFVLYAKAKSAAAIAEAGVMAGAEFDTGTSAPVLVHEVKLAAR